MTSKHYKRTIVLIDRGIQLKYFAIFAALGGGLTALWGTVVVLVRRQLDVQQGLSLDEVGATSAAGGLFWWFVLAVIGLGVLTGLFGMLVTHRIAGPVFVMARAMQSIVDGKYPHLRPLRDSDDLQDLYSVLKKMVESLESTDRSEAIIIDKAIQALTGTMTEDARFAEAQLREMHLRKTSRFAASAAPKS